MLARESQSLQSDPIRRLQLQPNVTLTRNVSAATPLRQYPYAGNVHDDLGLELLLRLLMNDEATSLTVLQVVSSKSGIGELSDESRTVVEQMPKKVRDRITITTVESTDPVKSVIDASQHVSLTIAGANREWGIERQTLGRYTDVLAVECRSSLVVTRRYR